MGETFDPFYSRIRRDLYSEVTSRILAELERGAAPWIKPWAATSGQNVPQNAVSNRPYSGCNVILLWLTRGQGWPTPRFVTFKQAQETGGSVRKGEHGTKVYFVKQLRVKEGEGEAERLVPISARAIPAATAAHGYGLMDFT